MGLPRLLVFAAGTAYDGGSGFKNLVEASRDGRLRAEIVAVVSHHLHGGVQAKAAALRIPFRHFSPPRDGRAYQRLAVETGADFFALSGWPKQVRGLDPRRTINIHPGPLPRFGGHRMYGHYVHEAVMAAYERGEITLTEVCMHFVDGIYDHGPIFFRRRIRILREDTAKTLATRVNQWEHKYQPIITDMVVNGQITWDGVNPASLHVPAAYCLECEV